MSYQICIIFLFLEQKRDSLQNAEYIYMDVDLYYQTPNRTKIYQFLSFLGIAFI